MSKWISVNDRLPETDSDVLVCASRGWVYNEIELGKRVVIVGQYFKRYWRHVAGNFSGGIVVTHWMPFPKPPKD